MHTLARLFPALLAALVTLAAPARAQDDQNLPSPESLFEKHIEAIGGRDALAKQHDRILHGIYTVLSTGETQVLTIYAEAPNHLLAELVAPALGTTTRATDGADAWGTNNTGSPFSLTGRDRDDLMDSANFLGEADYKKAYSSTQTIGKANIDGKPAWRVDFVTQSGHKGAVYFDADSGLVVARQLFPDEKANNNTLIVVSDYKDFNGMKLPTKQRQLVGDKLTPAVEIEFRWIEVNTGKMPDFKAPANTTRIDQQPAPSN